MAERQDPDLDWDGGWRERWESGDGVDDLVLGPQHPYGRAANDTPSHRWGSRHAIVSIRHADPGDSASTEQFGLPTVSRPPRARRRTPLVAARGTESKAARDDRIAAQLGLTRRGLQDLRRRHAEVTASVRNLRRTSKLAAAAKALGLSPTELKRFRELESTPRRPARGPRRTPTVTPPEEPTGPFRPRSLAEFAAAFDVVRPRATGGTEAARATSTARLLRMSTVEFVYWRDRLNEATKAASQRRPKRRRSALLRAAQPRSQPTPIAPSTNGSAKVQRRIAVASALGITVDELSALRAARADASATTRDVAKSAQPAAIAVAMGVEVELLHALRDAERRAADIHRPEPAEARRPAPSTSRQVRLCGSCGGGITITGHCRCS